MVEELLLGRLLGYTYIRFVFIDEFLVKSTWHGVPNGVELAKEIRRTIRMARVRTGVVTINELYHERAISSRMPGSPGVLYR
jgi:hypothetical protein